MAKRPNSDKTLEILDKAKVILEETLADLRAQNNMSPAANDHRSVFDVRTELVHRIKNLDPQRTGAWEVELWTMPTDQLLDEYRNAILKFNCD